MNKRNLLIIVVIALFLVTSSTTILAAKKAKEKKVYFILSGAYTMVGDMGADGDYVAGSNDFPVTPSFSEMGGGLGILYNLSDSIGISVSADYLMGADVDKVDPSDGETYAYTTYDNLNIIAAVMLKFGGDTKFFISAGGGFNILMPYDDKEETGSLGSIIVVEAPESTSNFLISAGGGAIMNLGGAILKIEAQYVMVMDYEKNSILLKIGIGF